MYACAVRLYARVVSDLFYPAFVLSLTSRRRDVNAALNILFKNAERLGLILILHTQATSACIVMFPFHPT